MSAQIISFSKADPNQISFYSSQGEFRRATNNMILAFDAATKALDALSESGMATDLSNAALIVGTSYGELGATRDFLWNLATNKMARPMLFQNSLHNATLGFLLERLKMQGPSATISHRYFSAEKALEMALSLLEGDLCSMALVVAVDAHPSDLQPILEKTYPASVNLMDGASAMVLSRNVEGKNYPSLDEIEFFLPSPEETLPSLSSHYDSDGLQKIIENLHASSPIKLVKPNQSFSLVHLS